MTGIIQGEYPIKIYWRFKNLKSCPFNVGEITRQDGDMILILTFDNYSPPSPHYNWYDMNELIMVKRNVK